MLDPLSMLPPQKVVSLERTQSRVGPGSAGDGTGHGISTRAMLGVILASLVVWFGAGCRGYNLGNQYLYRSDIRTVHVAMFESDSYRRFLGQRLTEAVVRQIQANTPLAIADPEIADSFIQGRIVRERKRSITEDKFDDPRNIQIAWRIEVTWVDRAGVPLMPLQSVTIDRDENFIPEGGQSMSTAQQQLIERIARDIVNQMEMPW